MNNETATIEKLLGITSKRVTQREKKNSKIPAIQKNTKGFRRFLKTKSSYKYNGAKLLLKSKSG
jgi:hypothetical protein